MEDLSSIFERMGSDRITALAPTSQSAGNAIHSNALGLSAPGTEPASDTNSMPGEVTEHPPPELTAESRESPVLIDAAGTKVHGDSADRSSSYTVDDGAGWMASSASASPVSRMMVRRGQWNNID